MPLLEIKNLSKKYGSINAVSGLEMTVEQGSVFGFMGQNGAGKTTTLRMITGLANPTGGSISVCGTPVNFGSSAANRHIGYLPDVPEFYGFMRPREYLELCGKLYGMDKASISAKSSELLKLVGLENAKRTIGGFSRGMKQRLGIAQALIHSPELLILDEPTSALDPIGRKEVLDIIAALRGKLTVLFSTHILSDVERVCDTIGILHDGKLALKGGLEDILKKHSGQSVLLETLGCDRIHPLKAELKKLDYIKDLKEEAQGGLIVICSSAQRLYSDICPLLARLNIPLVRFERLESKLEDIFIEVTKDE